LIALLAAAAFVMPAIEASAPAHAQGAFPAPLPGQAAAPSSSPFPPVGGAPAASPFPPVGGAPAASPFPPVGGAPAAARPADGAFTNGAAPLGGGFGMPQQQAGPSPDAAKCQTEFVALRNDAEAKAKAIQAAGKRKAPPQEACKLIGAFSRAELKMIKYVEGNTKRCGIPPDASAQMRKGHAHTEQLETKVCTIAERGPPQGGPAGPSLSEALGSASIPEAQKTRRGGSTFDTLNGNVLTR
jgi:hypothetical protein